MLSLPGEPGPTVRLRVKRSERNRLVLCKRITFGMAGSTLNGTPHYLHKHYWWAYVHPRAVWFFERQWLINLILYGNYAKLRDATLEEFTHDLQGNCSKFLVATAIYRCGSQSELRSAVAVWMSSTCYRCSLRI